MTGTTLLTGGSGKTATRIASRLQERGISVLLTSRKGQSGVPAGYKGVTFDWNDQSTFAKPFEADKNIDTIYIVVAGPGSGPDWIGATKRFIDFAKSKGVNRFLLMSGTPAEKGGPAHGQIHAYLEEIDSDYAVLRPTWFYGNLLLFQSIKHQDEFISATGTGRVGFISEDDIADIAVDLLSSPKLSGAEKIIIGPELLSYDDVADVFTEVLGRKITHRNVTRDERKAFYKAIGMTDDRAELLTSVEADLVANGTEEKFFQREDKVVGKVRIREFIEKNKAVWSK